MNAYIIIATYVTVVIGLFWFVIWIITRAAELAVYGDIEDGKLVWTVCAVPVPLISVVPLR